ncbi:hypothetical protein ACFQ0G_12660 [Streptomyces chiangmaiensis]
MLDLRHTRDTHPHAGRNVLLGQTVLLAGLGELLTADFGQQTASPGRHLFTINTSRVQLPLKDFPVLRGLLRHLHSSVPLT